MSILLEVCVATLDDALAAERGGADRLEVNAALELGGLTPSPGSFQLIQDACPLPLTVMLRPRRHNVLCFHLVNVSARPGDDQDQISLSR